MRTFFAARSRASAVARSSTAPTDRPEKRRTTVSSTMRSAAPSRLSSRGPLARKCSGRCRVQRSSGSITWESAEMRNIVLQLGPAPTPCQRAEDTSTSPPVGCIRDAVSSRTQPSESRPLVASNGALFCWIHATRVNAASSQDFARLYGRRATCRCRGREWSWSSTAPRHCGYSGHASQWAFEMVMSAPVGSPRSFPAPRA